VTALLQRLRAALASDYAIERELASGGMGVVFLGRDIALARPVAIKIIRPDLATAAGAERFLREARALASVSHPNIVPVHHAGEAGGLFYYVMDYVEGETLADRLHHGPLPPERAVRLGKDLLAALEAVHAQGIVHRDVKPSNVFLLADRAVLGDFGIAKTSGESSALTQPGGLIGTPGYMTPEQLTGGAVGPATDVCAAGMLLYEALTGRQWEFDEPTARADWTGVPRRLVPVLARALAWSASQRWQSAAEFRQALARAASGEGRRRGVVAAGVGAAALLTAATFWLWPRPWSAPLVSVATVEVRGGNGLGWLGDSVQGALVASLRNPDLQVVRAADASGKVWLRVGGVVRVTGDGDSLRLEVRPGSGSSGGEALVAHAEGTLARWVDVVDTLATGLLLDIWEQRDPALAAELPVSALPHTPAGMARAATAEGLWARAQWGQAYAAYQSVLEADSTCALCDLRLQDIARWLRLDPDTARSERLQRHLARFPERYQRLIRAQVDPTGRRYELLRNAAAHAPNFFFASFVEASELFHRGPLAGHERRESIEPFQHAATLWPAFAPVWEYLAWARTADGDSAEAKDALDRYGLHAASTDVESQVIYALLNGGFYWRFAPPEAAAQVTAQALAHPGIAGYRDLAAGASYMISFDAPAGAVWLGERFALWRERPELRVPGLVAQVMGLTALGLTDSALALAARLRDAGAGTEYPLLAAELRGALLLFDTATAGQLSSEWPALRLALSDIAGDGAATALQQRRAAWMLTLLARRAGDAQAERAHRSVLAGEPGLRPFTAFLEADSAARTDPRRALRLTEPLKSLDSSGRAEDPFFRSALHLLRAQRQADAGNLREALRELLWHENIDFVRAPSTPAQAVQVDWAFGTLARWYRAHLMERLARTGDAPCRAWGDVWRLWRGGDPRFAERAAIAAAKRPALRCESAP
jgi:hypothetical protein